MRAAPLAALDWAALGATVERDGFAVTPPVLAPADCRALAALFDDDARFRQTVEMARHRFGEGRYRYFAEPPPRLVAALRTDLYRHLAPIARRLARALGDELDVPATFAAYRARCAARGQRRPTPLLLRYGAGGYNCLHQDLYGDVVFPLQVTIMLSAPGRDFTGGEFLLVEQRPRMQSRGHAIALAEGAAIVFPCRERPARGARGTYRVGVRHGVATVRTGVRTTLGIIFHDAR
jgi:uncharacterized protein